MTLLPGLRVLFRLLPRSSFAPRLALVNNNLRDEEKCRDANCGGNESEREVDVTRVTARRK